MKKILLVLFILLILTGCNNNEYFSKNIFYMDTIINIKIYDNDLDKVNKAFNEIEEIYKKYENITNHYTESELYKINHSEETLPISDELLNLINIGLEWYEISEGLLNINIGSLTDRWHEFRTTKENFPTIEELNNIDTNINNIIIKDNLINGNFNIDLGAFVKGYVTGLAKQYLDKNGLNYYIINAGGNVVVGKSHKGYYNIGIKSPIDESNFYIIKGEEISVVTSGGYERFYEYNNTLYHHIIDPNTKYPANHMKSVTVIGKDSLLCDLLSTTLFLMDIDTGLEFVKNYDVDVIWFDNDNNIIKSDGFKYEQK